MNFNIQPNSFKLPTIQFRANNTISNNSINKESELERNPKQDSFEMSIGYVNDTHGQTNNMMRILSGIKGDLKLSAGDNDIGDEKNKAVHRATMKF